MEIIILLFAVYTIFKGIDAALDALGLTFSSGYKKKEKEPNFPFFPPSDKNKDDTENES